MENISLEEFHEMMALIRKGESVTCPLCGKGIFETNGDYRTSNSFQCSHCKKKIHINNAPSISKLLGI